MQNLHQRRLLVYLIGCPPMRAEFKFALVMANLALHDFCGLALQSAQAIIFHVVFRWYFLMCEFLNEDSS